MEAFLLWVDIGVCRVCDHVSATCLILVKPCSQIEGYSSWHIALVETMQAVVLDAARRKSFKGVS